MGSRLAVTVRERSTRLRLSLSVSLKPGEEWCRMCDLNTRPTAYKAVALPLS